MPLTLKPKKRLSEVNFDVVDRLMYGLRCDRLFAQILYNRGFCELEDARRFLYPDESLLQDPFSMLNMQKAVDRIKSAVERRERITVYGDYDVDGVSATTILVKALRLLNAEVEYYIPDRHSEGYGLNKDAVDKIFEGGTGLLVTVDCGIASVELVREQTKKGRDIIVTDHHTVIDQVPDCIVVKPGQAGDSYGAPELCGAGIAFKLAQALIGEKALEMLDYAAVATVADVVPLVNENRYIVKRGLEILNSGTRPCFKALLDAAEFDSDINESTLGFVIGPRLNAAGRVGSAEDALRLLLSEDENETKALAQRLCEYNLKRQDTEKLILEAAEKEIIENAHIRNYKVIVVSGEDWDDGVIGICAARLAEKYKRPAIIFTGTDILKGSGRSVEGIDLFALLESAKDILVQFGGHKMAAGMSVKKENVEKLREHLSHVITEYYDQKLLFPSITYDAKAQLSEITEDFCKRLELLSPCGNANPEVSLRIDKCTMGSMRRIGSLKNHLKLYLQDDTARVNAVAFGFEKHNGDYFEFESGTVIIRPELNVWQGVASVNAQVLNIKEKEMLSPRRKAEILTAMFYSRLNIKKTGLAKVNYVEESEELSYMISQWADEDITGTLILCDHPEYAAGCLKVISEEAPRFDTSFLRLVHAECGYNACVFGLETESLDLKAYKRVVFYDMLNSGYADMISEKAPWLEIYALKCQRDLFDTIFEEYLRIDRNNLGEAYKAICSNEGAFRSRCEYIKETSYAKGVAMPLIAVALDVFEELGFINIEQKTEFRLTVNRDAPKRKLEESTFYNNITKCIMSRNVK